MAHESVHGMIYNPAMDAEKHAFGTDLSQKNEGENASHFTKGN